MNRIKERKFIGFLKLTPFLVKIRNDVILIIQTL